MKTDENVRKQTKTYENGRKHTKTYENGKKTYESENNRELKKWAKKKRLLRDLKGQKNKNKK